MNTLHDCIYHPSFLHKTTSEVTGFWDKQTVSEKPAACIIRVNACALIMEISQNKSIYLSDYIVSYSRRYFFFISSDATALQDLGRQSGRRRSAKLVPTFADRGVSRGQRNGSPRPLISVYGTWIATYFIQVAPQLTSRG